MGTFQDWLLGLPPVAFAAVILPAALAPFMVLLALILTVVR